MLLFYLHSLALKLHAKKKSWHNKLKRGKVTNFTMLKLLSSKYLEIKFTKNAYFLKCRCSTIINLNLKHISIYLMILRNIQR